MSPNRAKLRFFGKTLRHMEFSMHVFFETKVSATEIEVTLEWLLCRPCQQSL